MSKGYQNLPQCSFRLGLHNECGMHMSILRFAVAQVRVIGQNKTSITKSAEHMICARLDLATLSVLDSRDNQLHQQTSRSD